jgi:hypothetical protein
MPDPGAIVLCLQISISRHCGPNTNPYRFTQNSGEVDSLNYKREGRSVRECELRECDHLFHNVLLIEATGRAPDQFRRTGIAVIYLDCSNNEDFFVGVEETDIVLV